MCSSDLSDCDTEWPRCKGCKRNLGFVCQVTDPKKKLGTIQLFMCRIGEDDRWIKRHFNKDTGRLHGMFVRQINYTDKYKYIPKPARMKVRSARPIVGWKRSYELPSPNYPLYEELTDTVKFEMRHFDVGRKTSSMVSKYRYKRDEPTVRFHWGGVRGKCDCPLRTSKSKKPRGHYWDEEQIFALGELGSENSGIIDEWRFRMIAVDGELLIDYHDRYLWDTSHLVFDGMKDPRAKTK